MAKEKEKCKHENLVQYEDQTKVFRIRGAEREIERTIVVSYFYCWDCKQAFNINTSDNKFNRN